MEKIEIDPDDTRLIRVRIRVLKNTPIKTDTVASLKLQGITGVIFIELSAGSPNSPMLPHAHDGHIPEIKAEQSSIDAIVNLLPDILQKASALMVQLTKVASDENIASISKTITNLQTFTDGLAGQTGNIAQLIQNANATVNELHGLTASAGPDIQQLTQNLDAASRELNSFITRTDHAAAGSYQELYQLLVELKKTTRDVRSLTNDIEQTRHSSFCRLKNKECPRHEPAPDDSVDPGACRLRHFA